MQRGKSEPPIDYHQKKPLPPDVLAGALQDTVHKELVPCETCGKPVERVRECYAHPTCYACLPPPPPLDTVSLDPEPEPMTADHERLMDRYGDERYAQGLRQRWPEAYADGFAAGERAGAEKMREEWDLWMYRNVEGYCGDELPTTDEVLSK